MKKIILFWVLILSACTSIATVLPMMTSTEPPIFTSSLTKTPASIYTDTSTPIPTLEPISGGWNGFYSSEYKFSFQYPAVYDEGFKSKIVPRFLCDIETGQDDDANFNIWVGNIRIIIKKIDQTLDNFSDAYLKEMRSNWNGSPAIQTTIDGVTAIRLEYRHKTRSGWGVKTYVIHNKGLVFFEHYEPSVYIDCAPPDTGHSDYWVYEQIIKTTKFD